MEERPRKHRNPRNSFGRIHDGLDYRLYDSAAREFGMVSASYDCDDIQVTGESRHRPRASRLFLIRREQFLQPCYDVISTPKLVSRYVGIRPYCFVKDSMWASLSRSHPVFTLR